MSKYDRKHLTTTQRIKIEKGLLDGNTFAAIARAIDKHPSTVAKEVKKLLHNVVMQQPLGTAFLYSSNFLSFSSFIPPNKSIVRYFPSAAPHSTIHLLWKSSFQIPLLLQFAAHPSFPEKH